MCVSACSCVSVLRLITIINYNWFFTFCTFIHEHVKYLLCSHGRNACFLNGWWRERPECRSWNVRGLFLLSNPIEFAKIYIPNVYNIHARKVHNTAIYIYSTYIFISFIHMLVPLSRTDASHTIAFGRTYSMPFLHSLHIQVKLSISFAPILSLVRPLYFPASLAQIFVHTLRCTVYMARYAVDTAVYVFVWLRAYVCDSPNTGNTRTAFFYSA